MKTVAVVVLGDLGRSPRMTYHTRSLLENGFEVVLIGYSGSSLPQDLLSHQYLRVNYLADTPKLLNKIPKICGYFLKALWQAVTLFLCLPLFSQLSSILVQTPPGIPTLPVLWLYSFLKGSRLIVDFHNYSHTILAMSTGERSPLVKVTRAIEQITARMGVGSSFCVSKAMQEDLKLNWRVPSTVLYDRPPERFRQISVEEKHRLFVKLSEKYDIFKGPEPSSTAFTKEHESGIVSYLDSRPGLLISSTSWTEDEDFSVLLSAMVSYEEKVVAGSSLPSMVVVITGKGPLKEHYLQKIEELQLSHVSFVTPWLESEDYPLMLGAADLGVCLHTSSSGLDLPMKVVDMFGCSLPVAAVKFPAIGELVEDGANGKLFSSSQELSGIIEDWFVGFPSSPCEEQLRFREELGKFGELRWRDNWNDVALPLLNPPENLAGRTDAPFSQFFCAIGLLLLIFSLLPVTS